MSAIVQAAAIAPRAVVQAADNCPMAAPAPCTQAATVYAAGVAMAWSLDWEDFEADTLPGVSEMGATT